MIMAKRTKNRRKREKAQQIYLPKCCQQPRSRGPKPRTDFSLFLCSSPSPSPSPPSSHPDDPAADRPFCPPRRRRGSILDFSSCKDGLSSITTASVELGCQASITQHKRKMSKFPLVQCSISHNGGKEELFSNSVGVTLTEVESIAQNILLDTYDDSNIGRHKSDNAGTSAFTPDKSTSLAVGSNDVCLTPGSVVWAKTARQVWWPAEIMGERSALVNANNRDVGHVLVQYYGNHDRAWVNPAEDISRFEDCFEEKSCNSVEAFQDALKQALRRMELISPFKQLDESPDIQHDQSSDKWDASSASRTEDDYLESGKGKRKRKPKVHFDEVMFPTKSVKKLRRFKIMRYLGLTAPIGSPFSLTSHVRTTYKSCRVLNI